MGSYYAVIEISKVNRMSQQRVGGHIKDPPQMEVNLLMYIRVSRQHMAHSKTLQGYFNYSFHTNLGDSPFLSSSDLHYRALLGASTNNISLAECPTSGIRCSDLFMIQLNSVIIPARYLTLTMLKVFTAGRLNVVILCFYSLPKFSPSSLETTVHNRWLIDTI